MASGGGSTRVPGRNVPASTVMKIVHKSPDRLVSSLQLAETSKLNGGGKRGEWLGDRGARSRH
jgi:hypothetical protein